MRATVRALIALLPIVLATPAVASAQNGKPFRALQAQISDLRQQIERITALTGSLDERVSALGASVLLLESRIENAEATVEELAARDELLDRWVADLYDRWRAAEGRLDAHEESVEALIEADRALQELIAALERQAGDEIGELGTLIEELRHELATKQALIVGACPAGSAIRQISSTGALTCESHSTTGGGAVGTLVMTEWSDDLRKVAPGLAGVSTMVCPSGSVATGGGYHKSAAAPLFLSAPSGNGWMAAVLNTTTSEVSVRAFVRCATLVAQ